MSDTQLRFAMGTGSLLDGFLVMASGDFAGTLIVLYTAKPVLAMRQR
jgi:hypothetical protein